ncbi:MAG: hypothetical protein KDD14_04970 [Saprospiraceae bacterium]|nr:hypothetical protein [Saprospiraceae bacterium]
MAAFFKKYRRDVVYMVVILGLVGWIAIDYPGKLNRALIEEFAESSRVGFGHVERLFNYYYDKIQKEADAFPEKNDAVWARTRQIRKLIEKAEETVRDVIKARYAEGRIVHKLSSNEIDTLKREFSVLADALVPLLGDDAPQWPQWIKQTLHSDSVAYARPNWAALSSDLGPKQAAVGLLNLAHSIRTAGVIAIGTCYQETQPQGIIEGFWMPVMSAERSVLRPGELFDADFFLTEYSTRTENLAVFVNDKPVAIKDGLANYRHRFDKPGVYKLDVRIDLKNPYTKQVKPFSKIFEVLVVEPCPGRE